MKTTISVCTLCLLLCVAGSNAQPVVRTMVRHNAPYRNAVRSVTDALDHAIERLKREDASDSTHPSVRFFTFDIQLAFAKFINDHFKAGHGLTPPGHCTTKRIDVRRVSRPFARAVRQVLNEHQNQYIRASSECLSNAVLDISLERLQSVNEGRCMDGDGDQFITVKDLLNHGFGKDLYDTVEDVILGMLENNENKAKNCNHHHGHDHDHDNDHDHYDYYDYYDYYGYYDYYDFFG